MKEAVQDIMKNIYKDGMTFKIAARRSDHNFELDSRDLNQVLGDAVFTAIPNVQVQMKSPDITLRVEIRPDAAYISHEEIKGAGGLPVGTSGKGTLMLSGVLIRLLRAIWLSNVGLKLKPSTLLARLIRVQVHLRKPMI